MTQWHSDARKRKVSGGRRWVCRKKRIYEMGRDPAETRLGDPSRTIQQVRGTKQKVRLLAEKYANITDPSTGSTSRVEITRIVKNPVNIDYDRRGILTKGAIIGTMLGEARVTSRPGQDGVINAVLVKKT